MIAKLLSNSKDTKIAILCLRHFLPQTHSLFGKPVIHEHHLCADSKVVQGIVTVFKVIKSRRAKQWCLFEILESFRIIEKWHWIQDGRHKM